MRMMTAWTAVALVTLGGCAPVTRGGVSGALPDAGDGTARSPLVGSWHLLWLDQPGSDGALRRVTDAKGSLIYTATGRVSVQVMYASAGDTPGGGPVQYTRLARGEG